MGQHTLSRDELGVHDIVLEQKSDADMQIPLQTGVRIGSHHLSDQIPQQQ